MNFEDSLLKRYPNVKLPPMDVITGQNVANQSLGLGGDMEDLLQQMPQQRKLRSSKK